MAEIIESVSISDELGDKFGAYAKYAIQDRALPDARDGLKPVQRRILYGMFEEGNTYDKGYRKAAKGVGAIMGNYHPHGDSSIYGAMVRLSQNWVMRHMLVDLHGNNGSVDGDGAASMRYTEVRLSKLAVDGMLQGVMKKGVVEMVDNFDTTAQEPTVLPVMFPNLLVNGVSGVSTGYACEVMPHNLVECLNGASALIENPHITVEELMQYIPAPDFPTGAIITGAGGLKSMYETGKGSVTVRSKYHFEQDKKLTRIVFTEIPYDLKKAKLIEKMDTLLEAKKVAGLLNVRDESGRDGMRIVVECVKETEQTVLSYLFKHTQLQMNVHLNMVVIIKRKPQLINLKQALQSFVDFRRETKVKEFTFEKNRLEARLHIVDGFVKLTDNLAPIVEIIQESEGKADGRAKIIEAFGFTEAQAEAIVTLPLHRISKQDKKEYLDELTKLVKAIKQLDTLLTSPNRMSTYLISSFDKLGKEFGEERKTELLVQEETWEVNQMDLIADEQVYVSVSEDGFLKRSSVRSYGATQACGVKDGDVTVLETEASTKDLLVVITTAGRYACVPVHVLEDARWGDVGKHIGTLAKLFEGERIHTALTYALDQVEDVHTIVVKSTGQLRRSILADCKPTRKTWNLSPFVKLGEGEEIHAVIATNENVALGFTDSLDRKMYFMSDEIPVTSMRSAGVRGIHLKNDELFKEFETGTVEEVEVKGFPYRPRGSRGQKVD